MIFDILALIVIAVLVAATIAIVVLLGNLPGKIARQRANPQADAITALGWVGIATLGLVWPIALVWAYWRSPEQQTQELSARITALEAELAAHKAGGGEA
ncbi:MAG: DUF3302 domain-containing protein [Gammaproteobacteria bacterium]|nr:MAG: DUF3302 domain-containing protein [Gammaproteobacteria bacterium]